MADDQGASGNNSRQGILIIVAVLVMVAASALVRPIDGEQWKAAGSDSARAMMRRVQSQCSESPGEFCRPE